MRQLTVSGTIDAPPERIWGIVTDLDGWVATISGIERVERLDGGTDFAVGTRWKETRTLFGKQATEEIEVVDVEPGRSYTTAAESAGVRYRSTVRVEPSGSGGRLTMGFAAEPQGLVGRLLGATLGRAFEGATRKALERDLADITAAAEARAATPASG